MATYTNLDSIHRASTGTVPPASWGDAVNDDVAYLYGDTAWTNVSFSNGWGGFVETVQYRKVGTRVFLRGGMSAGTANAAAFTLPVGYRPTQQHLFGAWDQTASAAKPVTVATTGTVTPGVGSDAIYLDLISFDTI